MPYICDEEHVCCDILNSESEDRILVSWLSSKGNDIYYKEFEYNLPLRDVSGIQKRTIITEYLPYGDIALFSLTQRKSVNSSGLFFLSYYINASGVGFAHIKRHYDELTVIDELPQKIIYSDPKILNGTYTINSLDSSCVPVNNSDDCYMIFYKLIWPVHIRTATEGINAKYVRRRILSEFNHPSLIVV